MNIVSVAWWTFKRNRYLFVIKWFYLSSASQNSSARMIRVILFWSCWGLAACHLCLLITWSGQLACRRWVSNIAVCLKCWVFSKSLNTNLIFWVSTVVLKGTLSVIFGFFNITINLGLIVNQSFINALLFHSLALSMSLFNWLGGIRRYCTWVLSISELASILDLNLIQTCRFPVSPLVLQDDTLISSNILLNVASSILGNPKLDMVVWNFV